MTESDWATSTDPQAMLSFLRDGGLVLNRKLRLFAVGCCRRVWRELADPHGRRAVEVAEEYADSYSQAIAAKLAAVLQAASAAASYTGGRLYHALFAARYAAWPAPHGDQPDLTYAASHAAMAAVEEVLATGRPGGSERAAQATFLRDLYGNPFHPLSFSPEWRTEVVLALARGIYEERLFERMPVLGDALEDAGCDSPDVLEHCRGPNVHVRGCWLIDEVLQKR